MRKPKHRVLQSDEWPESALQLVEALRVAGAQARRRALEQSERDGMPVGPFSTAPRR